MGVLSCTAGDKPLRGRKPRVLSLAPSDVDRLHTTAPSDRLPWYPVRRARMVLARAAGQRTRDVAAPMECGVATVWRTCERYRREGLDGLLVDGREGRSGRREQSTPVPRAPIREWACLEPMAKDWHITHWSSQDLARQAVAAGIGGSISPATVRRLVHAGDWQPHRTRYWKTARLEARFKERAAQVLWCYGNAERLAEQGLWVVCVAEIPTFPILERQPRGRAIPGSIEPQEFDDTRHGTVNLLVFLVVHTGLMALAFLAQNDNEPSLPERELYRQHHKELKGVFLIQDGGARHLAGTTPRYVAQSHRWWKPRYTPANASWLKQAEILIHAFKHYDLKRASWKTQEEFRTQVMASWPEYHHRYAHPFEWLWTNHKMRQWFAKHASGI